MKRALGFTLAEVLITLGIIGVVAALTIPSINQKISLNKNITSLKKTYSVLQQATLKVIAEHESPEYWTIADNDQDLVDDIYNYYKPHFNIMRECQNAPGCWGYPTKYLNGNVYWSNHVAGYYQYSFTLVDGVNVLLDIYDAGNSRSFGANVDYPCPVFWVDVNADKLPNQIGKDIFAFIITKKGLQPAGIDIDDEDGDCNSGGNGWTCTARIIRDGWTIKYSD